MPHRTSHGTGPPRRSRRARALFLVILWLGLAGTAEIAARGYVALTERDLSRMRRKYAWRRSKRLARVWPGQSPDYPYLPYIPKTEPPDVDMRGLRLTSAQEVKPADVFRIFCLGGSTTYLGYPAKLEDALRDDFARRGLRLEVVNAADISWTTCESFVNFTMRCLYYEPDAIIVYHAVNDAWPAFGKSFRPAYVHWRKRLVGNEPLWWDRVPRFMDHAAAYVLLREWSEEQTNMRTWAQTMMHYIPDFANDPYHGVDTYRTNIRNLIAVAREHDIQVVLATQVYNKDVPEQRLVAAVKEINDITRSLADEQHGVHLVDAAARIEGSDELMFDICHFRDDQGGEDMLVQTIGESVTRLLDH